MTTQIHLLGRKPVMRAIERKADQPRALDSETRDGKTVVKVPVGSTTWGHASVYDVSLPATPWGDV